LSIDIHTQPLTQTLFITQSIVARLLFIHICHTSCKSYLYQEWFSLHVFLLNSINIYIYIHNGEHCPYTIKVGTVCTVLKINIFHFATLIVLFNHIKLLHFNFPSTSFRVVILPISCVVLERNLDNVSMVSLMYIGLSVWISDGGMYGGSISTNRRVTGMFFYSLQLFFVKSF
jgi:hypothetical protein